MDTNLKIIDWTVDPTSGLITELNLNSDIDENITINGKVFKPVFTPVDAPVVEP